MLTLCKLSNACLRLIKMNFVIYAQNFSAIDRSHVLKPIEWLTPMVHHG